MPQQPTTMTTGDGTVLHVYRWRADGPARGIVQIAHGMAEHAGRYDRLGVALAAAGYAVYANDHRGHGRTAAGDVRGYLADEDGFGLVVEDLRTVTRAARETYPDVPLALLGHSMGSFLARTYAAGHGSDLDALVLAGTGADPGLAGRLGTVVAHVEGRLRGRRHPSTLLDRLTFGRYNAAFRPARTAFDWLSRDPAEVDAYVTDPFCGNVGAAGFFADLFDGVRTATSDASAARMPPDLPVLLLAGDADPVGESGRGVRGVEAQLRRAGLTDVTCILYPGARHEVFNETNRDAVTADLLTWLDGHLSRG